MGLDTRRMNFFQIILTILLIFIAYRVFNNIFVNKLSVEKAIIQSFSFGKKKVLEKQENEEDIPDDKACVLEDPPAYDFKGEELINPRDLKCNECNNYVHKEEDDTDMCHPYKYRDDGLCVINKDVKELCPF